MENNLKVNVDNAAKALGAQLKADNMYRSTAWLLYAVLVVMSFFISLGNAKFDFTKLMQAQFWVDFSITFFGSMLLKWAFSLWGDYEGHKKDEVVKVIKHIEKAWQYVGTNGLRDMLSVFLFQFNMRRKTQQLKSRAYTRLHQWFRPKKKYQRLKTCVLLSEEYYDSKTSDERKLEIEKELDDNDFDLDSYRIKYPKVKESALETGLSTSGNDSEQMTYSQMWEVFGKNIMLTLLSLFLTFVLAVSTVLFEDISLVTIIIFISRIGTFTMNSYIGFATGKSGVERIKYSVLKTIDRFLWRFLESHQILEVI